METTQPHPTHPWEHHRLAAQILRAWVREVQGALPAWTPPEVASAYVALAGALTHLVQVTQQAAREERRHA